VLRNRSRQRSEPDRTRGADHQALHSWDALLADAIGDLDCRSKAIETELKAAKSELNARGLDRAAGERFTVTLSQSIRISLDTTAIRAEMGAQWCDDRSKLIEITAMRVSVNKAALAIAA
jgi:hypothetical protein